MFLFSQHTTHALGLSHSLPVRFVSLLFVFLCILQLFFPVLLQYPWVCFAWRMHDNTIVVYDPCISAQAYTVALTSYEHVAKLLKSAMMLVSTTIPQGWRYDWEDARLEVFHDHACIPTWLV